MAEFVMKDLVERAGESGTWEIASAATSTEEIGNPVYPPVRKLLEAQGIHCSEKRAVQLTKQDGLYYDLLIAMDRENLRGIQRICGEVSQGKTHLLLEFTDSPGDLADPWYTRDFQGTWETMKRGCWALKKAVGKE